MEDFLRVLFLISILQSCDSVQNERSTEEKAIEIVFNYDKSPVDFTITDSTGFDLTFHKHKDSTVYTYFRFKAPESTKSLQATLPTLAGMWQSAEDKIDIQLNSINVGYPLLYNDVLTRHIETFANSEKWLSQVSANNRKINYTLVEEIISGSDIYPIDELLVDFGYEFRGVSVEKVGYVKPVKLVGLGYDESLLIPMPFMVWIIVEKKR